MPWPTVAPAARRAGRGTQYVFDPSYDVPNLGAFVYVEEVHIRDTVEGATGGHAVAVEVFEPPSHYGGTSGIQSERLEYTDNMI